MTNNGTLLLADGSNKNIRSVSIDNKVLSVLSLPASPTAITVLNEITAVAAARNKNLYIINISDYTTLSVRDELKLRYNIIAMTSRNDNLFVTCSTDPETTKKISIGGEELWSVSAYGSGRDLFSLPWGIATTIIDKTVVVIVTDWDKNTLTLLEAETGILMRTVDVEGKAPYGITVDSDGNAYICCLNTLEICVWSNGFKESKVLLSKLGEPPRYIVYSRVNDSLYIAYNTINRIDCFQIQ